MKDLKSKISMRSIYGLKALTKIFKAMDQRGDGNLDCDDFRWGLMDFGVQVSKDEAAELLNVFTVDGGQSVNFAKFLDSFRVSFKNLKSKSHIFIFISGSMQ